MSRRATNKTPGPVDTTGRISGIEAVSYTAAVAFVAALALGWFDAMVPWR